MQDNFPLSSLQMAELLNVSRETLDRLEIFEKLLRRWQKTINLVGTSTLNDIWRRHFLDCGQICNLTPLHMKNVVDIGSGAGFPGLVVSIISGCSATLIEADKRKAGQHSEHVGVRKGRSRKKREMHSAHLWALGKHFFVLCCLLFGRRAPI